MLIIGLTGGIASGKTTVSNLFGELGVPVLDADIAAREIVEPGTPGLAQLTAEFGEEILTDGALDRRRLRDIVFTDESARRRLERITHPLIHQRLTSQLHALRDEPYALLVVPLFVPGSALAKLMDRVLVVDVPVEVQRERVVARDGSSVEQADAIIAAQATREQRLAAADDVIVNDGDIAQLRPQVERLDAQYRELAGAQQA